MKFMPLEGIVLIEAITRLDEQNAELAKRLPGFELAKPKFQGAPQMGIVRHVGAGVTVGIGDKILFHHTGQRGFDIFGEKLVPVKADDILAIVEEDTIDRAD